MNYINYRLAIKCPDKIKYRRLLRKRGNKTPQSECLPLAVDYPVIAFNAESSCPSPTSLPLSRERTRLDIRTCHSYSAHRWIGRKLIETAMVRFQLNMESIQDDTIDWDHSAPRRPAASFPK